MVDGRFLPSISSEISVSCPIMMFYTLLCYVQGDELVAWSKKLCFKISSILSLGRRRAVNRLPM